MKKMRANGTLPPASQPIPEAEELKRLRKENSRLQMEVAILKKSGGVLREGESVKYAWIREHANEFSVTLMCRLLNVSRSGYYESRTALPSEQSKKRAGIAEAAKRFQRSKGILDRFHIMMHMSTAVDEVWCKEVRRLKAEKKDAVLAKSRFCFLKRPENLTENQSLRLGELLGMNLRTVKAYVLKESSICFGCTVVRAGGSLSG